MNHVERFRAVMNFEPVDRLPRWEWAMWWDETIAEDMSYNHGPMKQYRCYLRLLREHTEP